MAKNKVKIKIYGNDYFFTTEDEIDYVEALGDELDEKISKTLKENSRVSFAQASIFVALEYADLFHKSEKSADNLRNQIKGYLEDSQRYKMEAEVTKRELERLTRENKELRAKQR